MSSKKVFLCSQPVPQLSYDRRRLLSSLKILSTARWFSTLDLASGYWQVELTPRARRAVAFCSRKGLFEWNIMPFGLCNAPATFQRLMDHVLVGLQWEICLVYLDDVIILWSDVEQMLHHLSQVFDRLRQANLKLKPGKCCLFHREVGYLGHIVSAHGVATDPQKILKIQERPVPTSVSEVCQFVGLASYYRRFVRDFAAVACPLYELTKKNSSFRWTPLCQEAFEKLKNLLTSAPILGFPRDSGELILDTDASNVGIGSVLSQVQDGEERVLAYGGRRLSTTEQNYCTTRRELLAVVEFATHFRQYLLGRHFVVRTDHSSLQWLIRMKEPEGQLARWLENLGEYNFRVKHRPGRHHANADALSRRPCRDVCPCKVPDPKQGKENFTDQAVQCDLGALAMDSTTDSSPAVMDSVGVGPSSKPSGENPDRNKEAIRVVQGACSSTSSSIQLPFQGSSRVELSEAQRNDLEIAPIIRWLEEGQGRPSWVQVSHLGAAAKSYWSQWDRLYLRDDILLRRFYQVEDAVYYPQIILPQAFRQDVLKQMHDGPVGGHFGVERTLSRLQTRYYWFGMKQDVSLWCRTCQSCAAKDDWDPNDSELSSLFQSTVRNGDSPEHAPSEFLFTQPDTSAVPEGQSSGGSTVHQGQLWPLRDAERRQERCKMDKARHRFNAIPSQRCGIMLFQWNHRMASLRVAGGHGQQTLCLDPRQIQRVNQQAEFLFGKEHVLEPNFAAQMPLKLTSTPMRRSFLHHTPANQLVSPSKVTASLKGQYKRIADRVRDDPILSGLAIPLPNINAKSISTFISREEKKTNYAATVRPEVTPHLKVLSDMLFPEAPALPSPLPPPDRPQVQYQHVHHEAGKRRGEKRRLFVDEPQPVTPVNQPLQHRPPPPSSSLLLSLPSSRGLLYPLPSSRDLLHPLLSSRGLLHPLLSSRGLLLHTLMAHPLCQQHPYCWCSPHSHRPPLSCIVDHPAARRLYLLHQQ
ncbi:hypothetical protein ACEWY4_016790 [Coilia grayii]|uniref:Gypsy retrotransposon integrase-like protein 1 n=1 Tax=Coilia grayii TaxID=363190 RepID=A0ABD1JLE9_9TELE